MSCLGRGPLELTALLGGGELFSAYGAQKTQAKEQSIHPGWALQ